MFLLGKNNKRSLPSYLTLWKERAAVILLWFEVPTAKSQLLKSDLIAMILTRLLGNRHPSNL